MYGLSPQALARILSVVKARCQFRENLVNCQILQGTESFGLCAATARRRLPDGRRLRAAMLFTQEARKTKRGGELALDEGNSVYLLHLVAPIACKPAPTGWVMPAYPACCATALRRRRGETPAALGQIKPCAAQAAAESGNGYCHRPAAVHGPAPSPLRVAGTGVAGCLWPARPSGRQSLGQ